MSTKNAPRPGTPEAGRFCYYVGPECLVPGNGYRASVVYENIPGHIPTGDWPYTNARTQKLPYFWGPTFADAKAHCEWVNSRLGLSQDDVLAIIDHSMSLPDEEEDDAQGALMADAAEPGACGTTRGRA